MKINYDAAYRNNFGRNLDKAVPFFLTNTADKEDDEAIGFVLDAKALNPFLKVMETMGQTRNLMILPAFDNSNYEKPNEPAYAIFKIPETQYPESIGLTD